MNRYYIHKSHSYQFNLLTVVLLNDVFLRQKKGKQSYVKYSVLFNTVPTRNYCRKWYLPVDSF